MEITRQRLSPVVNFPTAHIARAYNRIDFVRCNHFPVLEGHFCSPMGDMEIAKHQHKYSHLLFFSHRTLLIDMIIDFVSKIYYFFIFLLFYNFPFLVHVNMLVVWNSRGAKTENGKSWGFGWLVKEFERMMGFFYNKNSLVIFAFKWRAHKNPTLRKNRKLH